MGRKRDVSLRCMCRFCDEPMATPAEAYEHFRSRRGTWSDCGDGFFNHVPAYVGTLLEFKKTDGAITVHGENIFYRCPVCGRILDITNATFELRADYVKAFGIGCVMCQGCHCHIFIKNKNIDCEFDVAPVVGLMRKIGSGRRKRG